jgi:PAS domain S-box-containing protein
VSHPFDEHYRGLFETADDPLLLVDPRSLRPVHFNPQALFLLGYTAANLSETTLDRLTGGLDPAAVDGMLRDLVQRGRADWRGCFHCGNGETVELTTRWESVRYWGRSAWLIRVEGAMPPGPIIPPSAPGGAEARREQLELQADERWRFIAAEAPGLIYQTCGPTDRFEMRVPYVNDRVEEYTGWTPAEIYERPMRLLQAIHPEDWPHYCDRAVEAMMQLAPFQIEMRMVHRRSGRVCWLRAMSRPRMLESGEQLWSGLALDITDLKETEAELRRLKRQAMGEARQENAARREAELRAMRLQSLLSRAGRADMMREVATGFAHEVHQPLAVIANYAGGGLRRLRAGDMDPAETASLLEEIAGEAMRAGEIARRIRGFLQGRGRHQEHWDLGELVADVVGMTGMLERWRDVRILHARCSEPLPVFADRGQVAHVLLALLANAVEAMEAAGTADPFVEIRLTRECNEAVVSVRDCGPGIGLEDRGRIFDQFFTTKPDGMGVGLSVSRSVIEAHGGTMRLVAGSPAGCEFRFTLPLEPAARPTDNAPDNGNAARHALPDRAEPSGA